MNSFVLSPLRCSLHLHLQGWLKFPWFFRRKNRSFVWVCCISNVFWTLIMVSEGRFCLSETEAISLDFFTEKLPHLHVNTQLCNRKVLKCKGKTWLSACALKQRHERILASSHNFCVRRCFGQGYGCVEAFNSDGWGQGPGPSSHALDQSWSSRGWKDGCMFWLW